MQVVLAEDSLLLREGLVRLLDEAGAEVVAAVGDGPALVEAVVAHRPDVAVEESYASDLLAAGGGVGYLLKDQSTSPRSSANSGCHRQATTTAGSWPY